MQRRAAILHADLSFPLSTSPSRVHSTSHTAAPAAVPNRPSASSYEHTNEWPPSTSTSGAQADAHGVRGALHRRVVQASDGRADRPQAWRLPLRSALWRDAMVEVERVEGGKDHPSGTQLSSR